VLDAPFGLSMPLSGWNMFPAFPGVVLAGGPFLREQK
jgi:hypothetical protein